MLCCLSRDYYIQNREDELAIQIMNDMCASFTPDFVSDGRFMWTYEITNDKKYIIVHKHWFSRSRIFVKIEVFLDFLCWMYGAVYTVKYKKIRNTINIIFYCRISTTAPRNKRPSFEISGQRLAQKPYIPIQVAPASETIPTWADRVRANT